MTKTLTAIEKKRRIKRALEEGSVVIPKDAGSVTLNFKNGEIRTIESRIIE